MKVIDHVDAAARHPAQRPLGRVVVPAGGGFLPVGVVYMGLELVEYSEFTGLFQAADFTGGFHPTAVMADLKDDTGGLGGGDGPPSFLHRQREGLFDEKIFSRAGGLVDDFSVGGVRSGDDNALDRIVAQYLSQALSRSAAEFFGEIPPRFFGPGEATEDFRLSAALRCPGEPDSPVAEAHKR
ncbi:MAG: hypothetical protein QF701_09615 [Nitrospinota bacterium]|nr:hypothetical protein [Nitrospinota bacterium]